VPRRPLRIRTRTKSKSAASDTNNISNVSPDLNLQGGEKVPSTSAALDTFGVKTQGKDNQMTVDGSTSVGYTNRAGLAREEGL
jgi:hypothetical protein